MKIPQKIKEEAEKLGYNHIEYIGKHNGVLAFSVSYDDGSGFPCPTGLPTVLVLDGDKVSIIGGDEALELL